MSDLEENISLALNINTEKARSEQIISPVLVEARKLLKHKISVDEAQGLNGFCDFILSDSPRPSVFRIACVMRG